MTATAPATRSPRPRLTIAPPRKSAPAIVPSTPKLFPLRQLVRAKENVRHTRTDEDVQELAADIAAHGLLQSLIGYEADDKVHIVGGGRRLQALESLWFDNRIDGEFSIPVLIRDAELAVELSLAENLQQRTMSPVDEFLAFRALVDTGHHTPADLAKRFGFSERVVKQRLRLADLAPDILDALADRQITLDAAMAYAGTQDRVLQAQIFKVEGKRSWDAHSVRNIRIALQSKGMRTSHPLFRYVGADAYEQRGGRYEDDLFRDDAVGETKVLADPVLLQTIAAEHIEFQMLRRLEELKADPALSPTIDGYVVVPGLKLMSWGYDGNLPTPPGLAAVTKHDHAPMWRTIRNNGVSAKVLVGVNDAGELTAWPRTVFVSKEQREAVGATQINPAHLPRSAEQLAEERRVRGVLMWQRRLAVSALGGFPLFAGTALEGRAYWSSSVGEDVTIEGMHGRYVALNVFVTDAEIEPHRKAAEARYRNELAAEEARAAERQAREAAAELRAAELREMDPPAVVAIDGEAWERRDDGSYAAASGDQDDFPGWDDLLDFYHVDDIEATFATRDEWLAAVDGASND